MKLHESPDDITDVLKEEAEGPGAAGSAAAINESDFAVESLELPAAPEKKEEAAAAASEPGEPKKTETVTQEKTVISPTGEKIIEKTIVVNEQAASEKSAAAARLFNPNTSLLMFDIFLTRVGGVFTPERPREYWALTPQDKKDLATLATESAKEGDWAGIPSKWLLMGALALMIGGKVVYAKKLEYKFVPGEKDGDPKAPAGSGGSENSSSNQVSDSDYKSLFTREKAKYEAEMGFKNNSDEIKELRKQNEYLFQLIEKAKNNKSPGGGISDADFTEVPTPVEKKPVFNEAGDYMFKDSQGRKWNLDKMRFTEKDAILDETKAGLSGYANSGIKLGNISAGQHEAAAEWRKYHKHKKVAA